MEPNDTNNANFYDQLQEEIESDMARMKTGVAIVKSLRLTAAEMEIETAALFLAEVWHDMEKLKTMTKEPNVVVMDPK